MNIPSPFCQNRYEPEGRHHFFLPRKGKFFFSFEDLCGTKSAYIFGTRGTGKTTLLKALDWRERHGEMYENDQYVNPSLRSEIKGFSSEYNVMGIYLKTTEGPYGHIDTGLLTFGSEELYSSVFCFYLELVYLGELFQNLNTLAKFDIVKASINEEIDFLKGQGTAFEHLIEISGYKPYEYTFFSAEKAIWSLKNLIRGKINCLELPRLVDSSQNWLLNICTLDRLEVSFSLLSNVSKFLSAHVNSYSQNKQWHFKVLIDEAENLRPIQQKSLNTLVRIAKHPLSFVAAYVKHPNTIDHTTTFLKDITLGKPDVNTCSYYAADGSRTDSFFKYYVDGVIKSRLKYACELPDARYDIEAILGRLSINQLLECILRISESHKAVELLKQAEKYQNLYGKRGIFTKDSALPIYETFLIDANIADIKELTKGKAENRRQKSRELRKKMVATYLHINSVYNLKRKPMYAFAEMVLQMSDGCVRDFLFQMQSIYDEVGKDLLTFLSSDLSNKLLLQDKALKHASNEKLSRLLQHQPVSDATKIYKLVCYLGNITAQIQSAGYDNKHLRSTERGIFVTDSESIDEELLVEAADAGYLVIVDKDKSSIKYRLHCSLAPEFGFSYRGAYYEINLSSKYLIEIIGAESHDDPTRVNAIVNDITREPSRLPLFEESMEEENLAN